MDIRNTKILVPPDFKLIVELIDLLIGLGCKVENLDGINKGWGIDSQLNVHLMTIWDYENSQFREISMDSLVVKFTPLVGLWVVSTRDVYTDTGKCLLDKRTVKLIKYVCSDINFWFDNMYGLGAYNATDGSWRPATAHEIPAEYTATTAIDILKSEDSPQKISNLTEHITSQITHLSNEKSYNNINTEIDLQRKNPSIKRGITREGIIASGRGQFGSIETRPKEYKTISSRFIG